MSAANSVDICGIPFPVQNYDDALTTFEAWIDEATPHQVCVANVHTIVTSMTDPVLHDIGVSAAMITMDGQPLRWYANIVHRASVAVRVCGPELMVRCLQHGVERGWRHYFYGGRQDVLEKLQAAMQGFYPGVNIVGMKSPPYRELSAQEDAEIVRDINDARPHFLWVGLGAPKQEKWIAEHLDRIGVPVQLGVGAAFDFHAGEIRRAPRFMQQMGLEWLYRAFKDPRLWRRYLRTNPVFLYVLLRDWWRVRILNRNLPAQGLTGSE